MYSPYMPNASNYKIQYIYTASRLNAAGLPIGAEITSLALDIATKNSSETIPSLTIQMGHTTNTTFPSSTFLSSLTTVYSQNYSTVVGWNTHNFSSGFVWNGTDNIVIQYCFEGKTSESSTWDYIYYENHSNTMNDLYGSCSSTTGGTDNYLPNIKFGYKVKPTLTITAVSETAGNTVAVPINAEDLVGLVGFQWTIVYDDSKLTYVDCDTWDGGVTPASVTINSSIPGKLMFVYNQHPNEIDITNGTFFNINFDIDLAATGTACLTWSDNPTARELSDAVPEVIDAVWENGCVTILPPPPTLIIDNTTTGSVGNAVALPINGIAISGLVGFQWTIDYDETKLTYVNCTNWHTDVNGTVTVFDNGDKLMFSHSNGSVVADEIDIANGKFFDINFTVDPGASGTACLSWSDDPTARELSDVTPAVITPVNWTDGCITIVLEGHWTGDVSTEWDNTGNWNDSHIPISGDNATIPDVSAGSNRYPLIDVVAVCANLTINADANVQIAPDFSLTVETTLINSAGNPGLIIKSDATGTGSLIHNTADIDGTVERFFGASSGTQWHFLSSPTVDAPRNLFHANNFYEYDESTGDYWASATDYQGTSGWGDPSGNLTTMKGYIYYYYQTTIDYEGKLHYDALGYNANVNYTDHTGDAMPPGEAPNNGPYNAWTSYDGWNLIGNPYPCTVDWQSVGLTDVNNTVYFYDDVAENYKYYNFAGGIYVNGMSVNGGTRYIPMGQGFFVKTDDIVDGGVITLPLASLSHEIQPFWKNDKDNIDEKYIKLSTSSEDFNDELIIRVLEDATLDFDGQFDAYKRYSWNADVPQIYSMDISQNTEYAINTLPEFNENISIPLGYSINTAGNYFFELSEHKFEGVKVYIEDTYQNTNTLISEFDRYNFNINEGNTKDRFILHLVKNTTDIVNIENKVSIFPNPSNGEFTILSSNNKITNVEIIDITGKIITTEVFNNKTCNLNITACTSGIYTLKIKTNNSVFYEKIIIE